ncbi:MAG: hypothetical protein K0S76_1007 [Herbinix sp.]|jgi:hypothetical protein|nr:hypothetical protein [Herbinix sp.]
MFTPSELEQMPIEIERRMAELEIRIMEDIIRRIRINDEITRSADWQIYRMVQTGKSSDYIQQQIQQTLKLTNDEMDRLYSNVIQSGYARDKKLYEAVGKEFVPFKENQELQQLIQAVITQTKSEMVNITQTIGFTIDLGGKQVLAPMSQYLQQVLDTAVMGVTTGTFDYNSTLKKVVKEMTKSGLRRVDYANGWSNRIDVAARRALMTGITQVTSHINESNADQLGTDKFEVSWHASARPSHQEWQGRVYTKQQLVEVCGLGTGPGLMGWNCYHSYYPFIEGVSERQWSDEELDNMNAAENKPKVFNGKEYTTYEATQRQRQLETLMRAQRQRIKLLKSGDGAADDILTAQIDYRETMRKYKLFSEKMKLPQQKERIYMDGLGRVDPGGKLVAKSKKSDIIMTDKQFGNKVKRHAKDYGLDPSNQDDRMKLGNIINDIIDNRDEIVPGDWRGQPGISDFYIKGSDVVVVNNGKFVTVLKGGVENARVKDARKPKIQ